MVQWSILIGLRVPQLLYNVGQAWHCKERIQCLSVMGTADGCPTLLASCASTIPRQVKQQPNYLLHMHIAQNVLFLSKCRDKIEILKGKHWLHCLHVLYYHWSSCVISCAAFGSSSGYSTSEVLQAKTGKEGKEKVCGSTSTHL